MVPSDRNKIRMSAGVDAEALNVLGTTHWDFGYSNEVVWERMTRRLADLPELAQELHRAVGLRPGEASMALIDWTALDNACYLLDADHRGVAWWDSRHDPYIAAADTAVFLGALIFYDCLIVLDYDHAMAERAERLVGLPGVIRVIEPNALHTKDRLMWRWLNAVFQYTLGELDFATNFDEPWLADLERGWKQLIPHAPFPRHDRPQYDTMLHYTPSPDRQSGTRMIFDRDPQGSLGHVLRTGEDLEELILDNDVRALFYEHLAEILGNVLDNGASERPLVRYLGNCLRSPMLAVRPLQTEQAISNMRRAAIETGTGFTRIPIDEWLAGTRANLFPSLRKRYPIRLPFWLNAVMAPLRSPSDLPNAVQALRKLARPFRHQRRDLERELHYGNEEKVRELMAALAGQSKALTQGMEDVAGTTLQAVKLASHLIPLLGVAHAGEFVDLYKHDPGLVRSLYLRLFRRQLWFIYSLSKQARRAENGITKLFDVFRVAASLTEEPTDFLKRLGTFRWVM